MKLEMKKDTALQAAIDSAVKKVPVVWPLQQLIATNPLWDLTDQSVYQAVKTVSQHTTVRGTLALAEYHAYYRDGEITHQDIEQAIEDTFDIFNTQKCAEQNPELTEKYKKIVYQYIISPEYQKKQRAAYQADIQSSAAAKKPILLSSQIARHLENDTLENIRSECLNWVMAYLNPSDFQAKFMAHKADVDHSDGEEAVQGFWRFWHDMMQHKSKAWKAFLADNPSDALDFIEAMLVKMNISPAHYDRYIFDVCWQLKGWVGYIKWQNEFPDNPYYNRDIQVSGLLAVWLALECFLLHGSAVYQRTSSVLQFDQVEPLPESIASAEVWREYIAELQPDLDAATTEAITTLSMCYLIENDALAWIWQRAYELSYQRPLYQAVCQQTTESDVTKPTDTAKAQWVFCIDVRSEGFRRHIEHVGRYETFGYAGFFGFAYQLNNQQTQQQSCQCPALIHPTLMATLLKERANLFQQLRAVQGQSVGEAKHGVLSAFALYEMLGLWFAFKLVINSYGPFLFNRSADKVPQKKVSQIQLDNWTFEDKVNSAKQLLLGISLTEGFAPFIVLCGHSAKTTNNPYQAALDCGACGGNAGVSNAVIACQVLNEKAVRAALAKEGITIDARTQFIPACHNTTTDEIEWYQPTSSLSDKQSQALEEVKADAKQAGCYLQNERLKSLPGYSDGQLRAQHWAELIPEWGLADNSTFIVAPRTLTAKLDLERRAFLHSYDNEADHDGSVLESILLGPMVVAHWINSQYYFSSVEPDHFGSGNKIIHNVLNHVGVMEGNQSDLKYGLSQQSVFYHDQRIHKPMRLFVLIDAPLSKIMALVKKHKSLSALVEGQWIWLKSLQDE